MEVQHLIKQYLVLIFGRKLLLSIQKKEIFIIYKDSVQKNVTFTRSA